MYWELNMNSWT